MQLYSDYILVVDLESQETEEIDLEKEFIQKYIGGKKANEQLLKEHGEDAIILGSGILTSTLAPGSSLICLSGKSPLNNKISHSAIRWFAGAELKLSGYSFVVIKGRAEKPIYLWIHDEIADINSADELIGKDTWQTVDFIRETQGEEKIQVLSIGKYGEQKSNLAQICNNYFGSSDRFAFGKLFGEKNLKAIAFRGMGELEIAMPKDFVLKSNELLNSLKAEINNDKGFSFVPELKNSAEQLNKIVHRYASCFNCPFPCIGFVKLGEETVMVADITAFNSFLQNFSSLESANALQRCHKLGLEPFNASKLINKIDDLENLGNAEIKNEEIFSNYIPKFGNWEEKNSLGYNVGICPVLLLRTNSYSEEKILELIKLGTNLEIKKEDLY